MEGGRSQAAVFPVQKPLTVLARAVLGLGSWEAEKWVWGPGKQRNGSGQLVLEASSLQADYLMERFLHRR